MDRNFDSTSSPNDPVKPGGATRKRAARDVAGFRPGRRSESGPTLSLASNSWERRRREQLDRLADSRGISFRNLPHEFGEPSVIDGVFEDGSVELIHLDFGFKPTYIDGNEPLTDLAKAAAREFVLEAGHPWRHSEDISLTIFHVESGRSISVDLTDEVRRTWPEARVTLMGMDLEIPAWALNLQECSLCELTPDPESD